jgi:hypothetical protein
LTPDDEEKLGRQMLAFERACYKLGLRDSLPVDMWTGRGEAVYLTEGAYEIYDYLLQNPGSGYAEMVVALGKNRPLIRNHISYLTRREIVRGYESDEPSNRGPSVMKYRVVRKIPRRRSK